MRRWSRIRKAETAAECAGSRKARGARPAGIPASGAGTKAFLVCSVAALLVAQVWLFMGALPSALGGKVDFTAFYRAGAILREGQARQLYQVKLQRSVDTSALGQPSTATRYFYHPAYEALVFAPLARLSYRSAFWAWTAASAVFLLAGALALGLNPFVAFAFFPVVVALAQGQDSLLLLAMVAFAFREFRAGREIPAGMILGLALVKFQYTLPLVAILALRRRYRLVAGFALAAAVVGGISLLIVGPQGAVEYARILLRHGTPRDGLMPNVHGLVEYFGGGLWPTLVLSGAIVAWSAIKRVPTEEQEFALAVVAAVLVSFHGYVADLPLLLVPMAAEFRSGRWFSLIFFATPLYLLLFERGMWPLIALGLAGFLLSISLAAPTPASREAERPA